MKKQRKKSKYLWNALDSHHCIFDLNKTLYFQNCAVAAVYFLTRYYLFHSEQPQRCCANISNSFNLNISKEKLNRFFFQKTKKNQHFETTFKQAAYFRVAVHVVFTHSKLPSLAFNKYCLLHIKWYAFLRGNSLPKDHLNA